MWLLRYLITGLVALALLGGVGYGLWVTGEQIYLRFLGRRVRATIVDYEMHSSDSGEHYSVTVDYPVDGGEYLRNVRLRGTVGDAVRGEPILVYYDPRRPRRARAGDAIEIFETAMLTATGGGIALTALVCLLQRR